MKMTKRNEYVVCLVHLSVCLSVAGRHFIQYNTRKKKSRLIRVYFSSRHKKHERSVNFVCCGAAPLCAGTRTLTLEQPRVPSSFGPYKYTRVLGMSVYERATGPDHLDRYRSGLSNKKSHMSTLRPSTLSLDQVASNWERWEGSAHAEATHIFFR